MSSQNQGEESVVKRMKPRERVSDLEQRVQRVVDLMPKAEAALQSIEQYVAKAAERNQHIFESSEFATKTQGELRLAIAKVEELTRKSGEYADAEQERDIAAEEALEKMKILVAEASAGLAEVKRHVGETETREEEHRKLYIRADALALQLKQYEDTVTSLQRDSKLTLDRINDLLPAATTAGLAASFESRRKSLHQSLKLWQIGVIVSLLLLVAIALYDYKTLTDPTLSISHLGLVVLRRIPLVAPVLWLIIYCARQAATGQRVEEEYAFKASISRSFEGYKKQMMDLEIANDEPENAPIRQLCRETLGILSAAPGRIYDRHRSDVTPLTAIAESGPDITKMVKELYSIAQAVKDVPKDSGDQTTT